VTASDTAPKVIVIVDDNEQIRTLVRRALQSKGYIVLDWANPRAALDHLEKIPEPVSLALIDGVMPQMLGPDVAGEISRLRPGVPILLMSGHEAPMFEKFFEYPDRHFIAKPFVIADLLERIKTILASKSGD
jgi:two-component system, cell cycle sensor histidine kinase and response regulator CckA